MKVQPPQIKKILYTTDLSDTSLHAFSYAVSLANLYKANITILHVMADNSDIEPFLINVLDEDQIQAIRNRHQDEAKQTLTGKRRANVVAKEALSQFAEDVKTDTGSLSLDKDEVLVLRGEPAKTILEVSKEHKHDLIVMGTHGHGIIKDLLGSTARKVTQHAGIPVLSVPLMK
ncbi:MAG: universal stress protein [Desulfobacterales bacterium]|nr:universal stress protein [Desulfobacterales bacterium]